MAWTTILPIIMSAISLLICVLTFFNNGKKDAIKDTKDTAEEHVNQVLISYRLDKVESKLDKIIEALDSSKKETIQEVKNIVQAEINHHIALYHTKADIKE